MSQKSSKPNRHIFVCVNKRPSDDPKGCCADRNGEALRDRLKQECLPFGTDVRVTRSNCLGPCQHGANVVIYPEGVWYSHVQVDDINEIVDQHLRKNQVVQRLLNRDMHPENQPNPKI